MAKPKHNRPGGSDRHKHKKRDGDAAGERNTKKPQAKPKEFKFKVG